MNLLIALVVANIVFFIAQVLYFTTRHVKMQAKFTITFTEVNPVPPITLTTTAFNGIVGTAETGSLGPTGGNGGPFTVTVDPNTPPPAGIAIDAQGNISGTPTSAGTTSVNVTVADSQG